jgi:hydrogenase maturation protein HypF
MTATRARGVRVRGVVQGVGFRPFVFRLARVHALAGWVLNGEDGVEIHLEGPEPALDAFLMDLKAQPPAAARIAEIEARGAEPAGFCDFSIRSSRRDGAPTVRISPDLPVCDACLAELCDPANPRFHYPYINCTECGPRYSVLLSLPYDRRNTTMRDWALDEYCARQYSDAADRRFHAQPVACPACGPGYFLEFADASALKPSTGDAAITDTVNLLRAGKIVAVKGIGGYHLACDADNSVAALALRERKFRKEKPFAVMARDLATARTLVDLSADAEALLLSSPRPIVLAPAKISLPAIAPDCDELGVMLPYAPLHYLLFAAGAPAVLVMTSANRSSEPIAYEDGEARRSAAGIADAFLIGERPIARRLDDSVARAGAFGPVVLRRSRGYAPSAAANIPSSRPILAVGADLKNAITLVVNGQAFVSQHIGDLDEYACLESFRQTIEDLTSMYQVDWEQLIVAHDAHPQYRSSLHARELAGSRHHAVQHHRAHIASVLAERGAWTKRVLGVSFDGTGYGDDGSIWGGEIFSGSVRDGFARIAHLRPAALPGGDAAARYPLQAAAGFLAQIDDLPDLEFPERFAQSLELVRRNFRTFRTTSVGRLFDAAAAILGFTRAMTFEGQAAMWVEHLARGASFERIASRAAPYPFPALDYRPLLHALALDRSRGRDLAECAAAFEMGVARGLFDVCAAHAADTVVLSGGVFQNELLLERLKSLFDGAGIAVWTNRAVPPNDGGISLGQAAIAAFFSCDAFAASEQPHA